MRTPWGQSQHATHYDEGIVFYGTASHGGFKLDRARNAMVPTYMRSAGGWYEVDCEWCKVALIFPAAFIKHDGERAPKAIDDARNTFRHWLPDEYERFYGVTLLPGESNARDEKRFYEDHASDLIVVSASGDWHKSVPKGMVGVTAAIGGNRNHINSDGGKCRHFLVPADEYKERRSVGGFIVDVTRHAEIPTL